MVACAIDLGICPSGYLQLDQDYTCEYIEMGKGDPIVLVPGLFGGIGLLQPLIAELSKDFRVFSYQLRGEGRDGLERGFRFHRYALDLEQIISALRLERPGIVGVSFGGAVALDFAASFPHRAQFIVTQGAGAVYIPGLFGSVAREVLRRLPLASNSPFVNQFFRVLIGGAKPARDQFDFIVERCWQTDQGVMAHRMALLDDYSILERAAQVRMPALVVGTERDVIVPVQEARGLAHQLPCARFDTIPSAGHLAFVTHSRQLTDVIDRFASELNAN